MYGEPQSDCGLSAVTSESAMKRGAALVEKARAQEVFTSSWQVPHILLTSA